MGSQPFPVLMTSRLIIMAVFLTVLFGGLFGYDYHRKAQSQAAFAAYRPPPVPVTVAVAEKRAVPRTLNSVGTLEAVRQVVISAEVDGRVTALNFEPGSEVKAGQLLVRLNDDPERADLQRLQAQAKLARLNLERAEKLKSLAVSQSDLDTRQANLDEVTGDIAKTQALIAQKSVRAPFDGVLGVRQVNLGQYVKPGDPMVTLTDLSVLNVNITVPEQVRGQLAAGQSLTFSVDAYPGREFTARVVAIEPQIGVDTRSMIVQARLDNPERLLSHGMFAKAALDLPAEAEAVTVPETAVDFSIHGDSVFVVRDVPAGDGTEAHLQAARVLVKPGSRFADRVVILSGVAPGERVVVAGQLNLQDGAQVLTVSNATLSTSGADRRP